TARRPAAVQGRDRPGYARSGKNRRARVAPQTQQEDPPRSGIDLFEMPGESSRAALRQRRGTGGGSRQLPERPGDARPARLDLGKGGPLGEEAADGGGPVGSATANGRAGVCRRVNGIGSSLAG